MKMQSFASIFGFKFKIFEPDILLKGGEKFELGETVLEVIHTPGHSPGSVCFTSQKKWLFSGDTVLHMEALEDTICPEAMQWSF